MAILLLQPAEYSFGPVLFVLVLIGIVCSLVGVLLLFMHRGIEKKGGKYEKLGQVVGEIGSALIVVAVLAFVVDIPLGYLQNRAVKDILAEQTKTVEELFNKNQELTAKKSEKLFTALDERAGRLRDLLDQRTTTLSDEFNRRSEELTRVVNEDVVDQLAGFLRQGLVTQLTGVAGVDAAVEIEKQIIDRTFRYERYEIDVRIDPATDSEGKNTDYVAIKADTQLLLTNSTGNSVTWKTGLSFRDIAPGLTARVERIEVYPLGRNGKPLDEPIKKLNEEEINALVTEANTPSTGAKKTVEFEFVMPAGQTYMIRRKSVAFEKDDGEYTFVVRYACGRIIVDGSYDRDALDMTGYYLHPDELDKATYRIEAGTIRARMERAFLPYQGFYLNWEPKSF